ncbi:hypothetical protein [Parendozoicomonas sp. Alg238-R29]|uniref:hypothetical protein n=1 Tax=Parendozoicomonas sp. Alg238-R29 TaxID=2993446 RepID=UPI00248ED3D8|nr:hypothetical protein [Parendozoicomonas sp. Alg238-R29]
MNNLCPSHGYGSFHRRHRVYFPDRIHPGPILSGSKHSVLRTVLDDILTEHLGFKRSVNFIGFVPCKYANLYASENGFTDDYLTSSPLHNKYTHLIQQGSRAVEGLLKRQHYPQVVNTGVWADMLDRVTFKNDKCTEVDDALSGSATNSLNHQLICGLFSRGIRNILIEQNEELMRATLAEYFHTPNTQYMPLAECITQLEGILFNLHCVETYLLDSFFKGMDRYVRRVTVDEMVTYGDCQGRWRLTNKPKHPTCAEDIFSLPTLSCGDFIVPLTAAAKDKGERHCKNGSGEKVCEEATTGYIIRPSREDRKDVIKPDDAC